MLEFSPAEFIAVILLVVLFTSMIWVGSLLVLASRVPKDLLAWMELQEQINVELLQQTMERGDR